MARRRRIPARGELAGKRASPAPTRVEFAPRRPFVAHAVLILSGFAGLGYEIVWTRMFALGLGHELPALVAVLAAFFGGLCVGGWCLDAIIARSAYPGRWYAGCEAVIAIWALASTALIPLANELVLQWTGVTPTPLRQWAVAFVVPWLVLLPATVAMGATLPAIDRLVGRWQSQGRVIGGLYAANTLGAVLGTLSATFVLIPAFGYRGTLWVMAALNVGCAASALLPEFRRRLSPGPADERHDSALGRWRLATALFCTGLFGIGYQVGGVYVMSQVTENTVYSFASILAVYLSFTALGAAAFQYFGRQFDPRSMLRALLIGLCIACLIGVMTLGRSGRIYEAANARLGTSMWSAVAAEMALAAAVFALPSGLMGALFSHLAQQARGARGGIGYALGLNTLGGALAPLLLAAGLLPLVGAKWLLSTISLGYLTLAPSATLRQRAVLLMPFFLLLLLPRHLLLVEPPLGGETLAEREGLLAAVAVVADRDGQRYLKVNNRFYMGATVNPSNERRLAHIPLLLHPAPRQALFLGLGTGSTLAAARAHPQLRATAVELVPEIVELQPMFSAVTGDLRSDPALAVATADARRYVATTTETYDVIVADLFHPARDGAGALYSEEHFRAVRNRLRSQGLFCQWLPLYQMDRETMLTIVRTYLRIFPHGRAYLSHFDVQKPVLGLIGAANATAYPPDWLEKRAIAPPLRQAITEAGLSDGLTLFGFYLGSGEQLAALVGEGPINRDDFPVVNYLAPAFAYTARQSSHETLAWLLDSLHSDPSELALDRAQGVGERFTERLSRYIAARDAFLRAEIARVRGSTGAAIDGYLSSARLSEDFDLGYFLALSTAERMASAGQVDGARSLLNRLIDAAPQRDDARKLLRALAGVE